MPPDPVLAKVAPMFADALKAYLKSRNAAAFEKAMQTILTRAHTATYFRGVAERLDVSVSTLKGLSRYERTQLRTILAQQFEALRGFADKIGGLSDAQIAARVALYAASAKASYWLAWAGKQLECYPGNCPDCYSNCRCSLERRDGGVYWDGPGDAHSCRGCRGRIGRRMG